MEHVIPTWMLIPFVIQLLCIAILPLTKLGDWWESNLHKLYVSLILGIPVGAWLVFNGMSEALIDQMVYDYVPFILLLMALFVTTGGICIKGDLKASPTINTIILAVGFVLASFMGTTGAAMLLIRLLLQTNKQRKYKTHTVLFFIAVVANCGGILSPLGDPPLFLLFQKGAPFTWFMGMWPEWLATGVLMLGTYFCLDTYYYKKESKDALEADEREKTKMSVSGLINIVWLLCVIASTMFLTKENFAVWFGYAPKNATPEVLAKAVEELPPYLKLLREIVFFLIIVMSMRTTKKKVRVANEYSVAPILEVACVFVGIFATMTPALMYLAAHPVPVTEPWQFVYCTGALSSFLDNAPTAMVFHATACSLHTTGPMVAGVGEVFLRAICMGAVFFGSMTYIGNGPNFMVKSIAEQSGYKMPSFFGYMLKFSLIICLPIYIIVQLIFL